MPELTEKVARAIYGARIKGLDLYPYDSDLFEKAIDAGWRLCEGEARAAILAVLDAIAEPSDAMRISGRRVLASQDQLTDEECAASAYRAMIAALRKEIANV
jgi:hypothetical protein